MLLSCVQQSSERVGKELIPVQVETSSLPGSEEQSYFTLRSMYKSNAILLVQKEKAGRDF